MSKIVVVDSGNAGTNACVEKGKTKFESIYFPSIRKPVSGEFLDIEGLQQKYTFYDWGAYRYTVGDDAITVKNGQLEHHVGEDRYGNEFHHFMTSVAIANLGIKNKEEIELVVFAPPGIYNEVKPKIVERFMSREGKDWININGEEKPLEWSYKSIDVLPEGVGALSMFAINSDGTISNSDELKGQVVFLDGGGFTLDTSIIADGVFNLGDLNRATHKNAGVVQHVLQPTLTFLQENYTAARYMSVFDVDAAFRNGIQKNNWLMDMGQVEIDVSPLFERYSKRYAEWIANSILAPSYNALAGVKSVVLIGGLPAYTAKYFKEWYPNVTFIDTNVHPVTKNVGSIYVNAVGGLRWKKYKQTLQK